MIYILHLSDLHFFRSADWQNMKEEIIRIAGEKFKPIPRGQKLLILTGDFRNRENINDVEFLDARNFLKELINAMDIERNKDVFLVPGNHDVTHGATGREKFIEYVRSNLGREIDLNMWENHIKYAFEHYNRFISESGFYDEYKNETDLLPEMVHVRSWRDKINILHLNTALASAIDDKDEGKLQCVDIFTATSDEIREKLRDGNRPGIVIAHHHFHDLEKRNRNALCPLFNYGLISAYCCGDRHKSTKDSLRINEEEKIPIITGYRGTTDEKDIYSFSGMLIYELDEVRNILRIMSSEWSADNNLGKMKMVYDAENYVIRRATKINVDNNDLVEEGFSFADIIAQEQKEKSNIYMTFKSLTENDEFSLHKKLYHAEELYLLNFAGTSFISGIDVAQTYNVTENYRKIFEENLIFGNLKCSIVLANPMTYANTDAASYKMYPNSLKTGVQKEDIIPMNISKLVLFKRKNPDVDLTLRLTSICLPYGIMNAVNHTNRMKSYMKVDLYSPVLDTDDNRPSFHLTEYKDNTRSLYTHFQNTMFRIFESDRYSKDVRTIIDDNLEWLYDDKNIIHRGVISDTTKEHTKSGFRKCIDMGYPIEIDLMQLKSGEIIVYRDCDILYRNKKLSKCTYKEFLDIKKRARGIGDNSGINEAMEFSEFLKFINGRVPVLIEIKYFGFKKSDPDRENLVKKVMRTLLKYQGAYALHSSNPYVVKAGKEYNVLAPFGQISWNDDSVKLDLEVREMHQKGEFTDIIVPDFISYKVQNLADESTFRMIKSIAEDNEIPIFGWTVKNREDEELGRKTCNRIIIEGATTFIEE